MPRISDGQLKLFVYNFQIGRQDQTKPLCWLKNGDTSALVVFKNGKYSKSFI